VNGAPGWPAEQGFEPGSDAGARAASAFEAPALATRGDAQGFGMTVVRFPFVI
jgi:hypothetical protein